VKIVATRCEIFSRKFIKYRLATRLRPDPLGELKRSPRTPSRNKMGLLLREGKGKGEWEGRGGEQRKVKGKGEKKGEKGKRSRRGGKEGRRGGEEKERAG